MSINFRRDSTPIYLRKRYLIVFLSFLGYVNLYTMRVDLSVAIVALTENRTVTHADGSISYEQYFDWDSKERGIALGAFFYGYITTQFLGGYIASKFSGRMVSFIGLNLSKLQELLKLSPHLNDYFYKMSNNIHLL